MDAVITQLDCHAKHYPHALLQNAHYPCIFPQSLYAKPSPNTQTPLRTQKKTKHECLTLFASLIKQGSMNQSNITHSLVLHGHALPGTQLLGGHHTHVLSTVSRCHSGAALDSAPPCSATSHPATHRKPGPWCSCWCSSGAPPQLPHNAPLSSIRHRLIDNRTALNPIFAAIVLGMMTRWRCVPVQVHVPLILTEPST
jgi:hypothetical protein